MNLIQNLVSRIKPVVSSNSTSVLLSKYLNPFQCLTSLRHLNTLWHMHSNTLYITGVRPQKKSKIDEQPHIKGIVLKTLIKKPRKPNSANRKCVRVRLANGVEVIAHVPGEGHNLQEHHSVLVKGGRTKDLPGVHHKVIRGKLDCAHVVKRQTTPSQTAPPPT
ncbi:unnamed protein product [Didymodactylos carnosus]|uniref:Small ribosomal subunit protein uS12m n=1 Tax=Didymodactylos carnosus TaxID=1234261 RepID=A0A814R200_9BILA|nr:unnamed protein product [Didymodactylos carnosus]CAF1253653.1 unnamed protein product [Didymodactylos carnosus]CAF3889392.1 unnamed protein product [Didymodactylos carnosus]CAF4060882.1 unnamed protein product [Didymodactylos carnosus]